MMQPAEDLLHRLENRKFSTILADPPWRFDNKTGKMAPEHKRLSRYSTLSFDEIAALPIASVVNEPAHLYLWVPNALLAYGLDTMRKWGFEYKTNLIWYKVRKDGGPDRRGVGFYFRNVTEVILFGIRGKKARTLAPGRSQENVIVSRKREHSRKPDEQYSLIESCSPGPYLELFARGKRPGWFVWGDQSENYEPNWATYANHSQASARVSADKPVAQGQLLGSAENAP
ncbi:MAG: MT-A70 family methyltransferase [Gammaproteobacteria bacterium]|nr:MT-A70 family methyltransferase [Gammaproteobacteria bacterium]MDE0414713.1 MT-A70 family methyltransferase [Gammaproteobacteria bacterium]